MTDEDRIRLATKHGSKMLGPIERERCPRHPRRWVSYRWSWSIDGDISASEPQVVRGCGACAEDNS